MRGGRYREREGRGWDVRARATQPPSRQRLLISVAANPAGPPASMCNRNAAAESTSSYHVNSWSQNASNKPCNWRLLWWSDCTCDRLVGRRTRDQLIEWPRAGRHASCAYYLLRLWHVYLSVLDWFWREVSFGVSWLHCFGKLVKHFES